MTNPFVLNNSKLSELLSDTTRNIRYQIPLYQRGYVWKEEQWSTLLDDIKKNDVTRQVFMGVIISVEENQGSPPVIVREIVDGQQRMTTLFLLLLAFWKRLGELEWRKEGDYITEVNTIKKMLYEANDEVLRLVPAKISYNQNDLYEIVTSLDDHKFKQTEKIEKLKAPSIGSVEDLKDRLIYKCFNYFYNALSNMSIDEVVQLFNQSKQLQFVLITPQDKFSAYYLFQVLNDRGVDLSEMDIIKSYLFGQFKSKDGSFDTNDIEKRHKDWIELNEVLTTATVRERFFRHLYNASFRFQYKSSSSILPATQRTTLIRDYENMIQGIVGGSSSLSSRIVGFVTNSDSTISKLYDQIISAGNEYSVLLDAKSQKCIDLDQRLRNYLLDLKEIEASTANMLLLRIHLWIKEGVMVQDDNKYRELLQFLCAFYIRRNITGVPSTNKLDPFVVGLVELLEASRKDNSIVDPNGKIDWTKLIGVVRREYMTKLQPSTWQDFRIQLRQINMYEHHKKILKVLLIRIEEEFSQYKSTSSLRSDDLSIDHIHPQKPKAGIEVWEHEIGRLGNLTLLFSTNLNAAFSNSDFLKKRDFKNKHKLPVGYSATRFYLDILPFGDCSQGLSAADGWSKDRADKRTDAIIDVLFDKNILSLPGETSGR
jgi:hypothetical protein